MLSNPEEIEQTRQKLVECIGEKGVADAASVMAMFQLNTRAADAAGILVEEKTLSLIHI